MKLSTRKATITRWVAENELIAVNNWSNSFNRVLEQLALPPISLRYGITRTMQVCKISNNGVHELQLVELGCQPHNGLLTNQLVTQVYVEAIATLPLSHEDFGISKDVLERVISKFHSFKETKIPDRPRSVLINEFFAHINFVVRTHPKLNVSNGRITEKHASAAVHSIRTCEVPEFDAEQGRIIHEFVINHLDKLTPQARSLIIKGTMKIDSGNNSEIINALRIYAWATGYSIYHIDF